VLFEINKQTQHINKKFALYCKLAFNALFTMLVKRKLPAKGGLISKSFSLWLKSPFFCQIPILSIFSLGG
jgi:hypothetical protein